MRIKNWIAWIIAVSLVLVIMANLAGPVAWAASAAAPVGQTVPTKTPTPGPQPPSATEQAMPVSTVAPTPTGPPALLPQAGAGPDGRWALVGVAGLGFLALAWTIRRRAIR